ncbi:MAG: YajQ family cyclic di-GMP-binding protein [Gammaproteobacteria bacterium]
MPSFDVVSEVDLHEVSNSVDQANREVSTRFDFKGTGSKFELDGSTISLETQSDFQLEQMIGVLHAKMAKRGVDLDCLDEQEPQMLGKVARQTVVVRQGLDKDSARKLVKLIKESKLKVQAAIQGEQVRVTGKKRDDLQNIIASLREAKFELPLQFVNFRD